MMDLRIVPPSAADGTFDTGPMPEDVELARSSFRCIAGGAEQDPKSARQPMRPNSSIRLYQLRNRLFRAMGEAPDSMLPLIEELVRIAEGDVDPDPEAA
jgi:hypothetical protein